MNRHLRWIFPKEPALKDEIYIREGMRPGYHSYDSKVKFRMMWKGMVVYSPMGQSDFSSMRIQLEMGLREFNWKYRLWCE